MKPAEVKSLEKHGYSVKELTPYQFRVEGMLDLYPKRQRFHNIVTQERGHYTIKGLEELVTAQIGAAHAKAKEPQAERRNGKWYRAENAPWWAKVVKP